MTGHLAWDEASAGPLPGVLIAPSVRGPTAFEAERAAILAGRGYAALVIDVYGIEARSAPDADMFALMAPLNEDRRLLQARMAAGLAALQGKAQVDATRIAAIGYCFGGKCVLDLARTRPDVSGVAAFHGLFDPPPFATLETIAAKVVAFHGWDDPLAPPEAVTALAAELTAKGCDWQIHAYGHTGHAFTNPDVHNHAQQMFHKPEADRRSWAALADFLEELFG